MGYKTTLNEKDNYVPYTKSFSVYSPKNNSSLTPYSTKIEANSYLTAKDEEIGWNVYKEEAKIKRKELGIS